MYGYNEVTFCGYIIYASKSYAIPLFTTLDYRQTIIKCLDFDICIQILKTKSTKFWIELHVKYGHYIIAWSLIQENLVKATIYRRCYVNPKKA